MTVNIIIPSSLNDKSLYHLNKCLKSIFIGDKASFKVKTHIVTNNPSYQKKNYKFSNKTVRVIFYSGSQGFSGLNNTAIDDLKNSKSDYVLFLNDDAWLAENFFSQFQKIIKYEIDCIVPLVLESDRKSIDSFGVEYFTSGYAKNCRSLDLKVTLASASCLLVKTTCLMKMKETYGFYFNEILYYYMEDVEFMIRIFMMNATIKRYPQLRAYHLGSTTSGKKSKFTMFQTYRNILWVIILTWPKEVIIRNSINITIVQLWVVFFSIWFGLDIYIRVLYETITHFSQLIVIRKKIIPQYSGKVNFNNIFSQYAFRTYHNRTFRF